MREPVNKLDNKSRYEQVSHWLLKSSPPSHVLGYLCDLYKSSNHQNVITEITFSHTCHVCGEEMKSNFNTLDNKFRVLSLKKMCCHCSSCGKVHSLKDMIT